MDKTNNLSALKHYFVKSLMFACALALLLFFGGQAHSFTFKPHLELDHPVVLAGRKNTVYLLVSFVVPQGARDTERRRPPLNIALVIDRSGSMSDQGKLSYAKEAAKIVVDRLGRKDLLAVVQYDDRVEVMWPSSPVESPHAIKRRIDRLHPGGSTNLTGGMMEGVDQVLDHQRRNDVTRVVLLSDGLANQGITDPRRIRTLVRQARRSGARISTMGLGLKYNENLMQDIAEAGGGRYYYIESPTQMARIFQEELSTLFDTMAKNPRLIFEPSDVVRDLEVIGYESSRDKGRYVISMEDFYAGEKRSLLLKLSLRPMSAGGSFLGELRFDYQDAKSKQDIKERSRLELTASDDAKLVDKSANQRARVEAELAETEKRHSELVKAYEAGRADVAQRGLRALARELEHKNRTLNDAALNHKLEAIQMEAQQQMRATASKSAAARQRYLKSSKQKLYMAKRGKRGMYILQEGDSGMQVERLQKVLKKNGFYKGPVDGHYSKVLTEAVKAFQGKEGLATDGVAGPRTMDRLGLY